jgi:hypothetical protein
VYNVPKGGGANAVFAAGIWIGGMVDGNLHVAATTYGPYEFWAGPLDDNGQAPAKCSDFDRVWVSLPASTTLHVPAPKLVGMPAATV